MKEMFRKLHTYPGISQSCVVFGLGKITHEAENGHPDCKCSLKGQRSKFRMDIKWKDKE